MRTASLEFELRALTEEGVRLPREDESSGVDGETTSGTTSRASPTRVFTATRVRIRDEKKNEERKRDAQDQRAPRKYPRQSRAIG